MRQVTLNIPDNEFNFFMKLVKSLAFVQINEPVAKKEDFILAETENASILEGLERSLQQMQDMRAGKRPKPPIAELFVNE